MKETERLLCQQIAEHYGKDTQIKKTIEELAELIRALATGTQADISEEIADAEIMIYQLIYLMGNEEAVAQMRTHKIFRQLERMEKENSVKAFKQYMDCMWE
jgi:phosphoribosyl-ATP pyrophosphohydrolase